MIANSASEFTTQSGDRPSIFFLFPAFFPPQFVTCNFNHSRNRHGALPPRVV